MNVKDAIKKVEKRIEKTQETIQKYLKKGNEMEFMLADGHEDPKQNWRIASKRDYYYRKYTIAEDYAEELKEIIQILRSKDLDDKVLFVGEEKFENEYALFGDSAEEWENTIASMVRCDLGDGRNVLAVCIKKMPN